MANVVGAKTTKAKEAESLKKARTQHRVGAGQLFIQPTAHADREAAQNFRAEDDDTAAVEFVRTGKAVSDAVSHVRPTYRYEAPQTREARCLECHGFHRNGASCSPTSIDAPVRRYPEPQGTLIDMGNGWRVRTGEGLATEKQAKWMIDIASRPSITEPMRESLRTRLEQGFARTAASAFITKYKDTPTAAEDAAAPGASTEERSATPEVDAGRYAVVHQGVLKFYRVSKGKGRWAGRTFVEVQASDTRYPLQSAFTRNEVLALIAENPLEAEQRYGQELGKCSRCGLTLTDEESRAYGIGPKCRSK